MPERGTLGVAPGAQVDTFAGSVAKAAWMSVEIGTPPWSREDLVAALPEFLSLYPKRPIRDNEGGMKAPHMFATWFMARRLAPKAIIESGAWKGQSTWLLEQACPDAELVSIDIDLSRREYISPRATYHDVDFSEIDWSEFPVESTLVFFDDHQNAYERLLQCRWFGIRDLLFEDNYPASRGDCYSLKKAFAGAGFDPEAARTRGVWRARLAHAIAGQAPSANLPGGGRVAADGRHAAMLYKNLEVYHEFPPLFVREQTRWGDAWREPEYPTPSALLDASERERYPVLWEEAQHYTWICYVRLRA